MATRARARKRKDRKYGAIAPAMMPTRNPLGIHPVGSMPNKPTTRIDRPVKW